ncbi:hypothetical protein SAMN05216349_11856 [Oribacterium sp. KHPX15]|uniref:hypothetical protein n=1 Tax=Oribacterium sp. KHPX15 TaxID=1855342 RepID=UPI00089C9C54|nr:hypothetical protein [Oribacterium sp. KHPX15]SEA59893.1 hypothetical protein SAMN05216349_11856 [Oribacterium sp. KHPX15]
MMNKLQFKVMVLSILVLMGVVENLVCFAGQKSDKKTAKESPAKVEYEKAVKLFDEGKYYSAEQAFIECKYGDWAKRAKECVQPVPETGELWHDKKKKSEETNLVIVVNEENPDTYRYYEVYDQNKKPVASLFVAGENTVETWLPEGYYYVKEATGTKWYGDKELFGAEGSYRTMVFNEIEDDRFLSLFEKGYQCEITINSSDSGGKGVESEVTDWDSWNE